MPRFDVVSEIDLSEVENAVQGALREITTRYDFKGSKCEMTRKDKEITILADDEYKRDQMEQMLKGYMVRRNLDPRSLEFKDPEKASGNALRQKVVIKEGIDSDTAKTITRAIKDNKMKVQASIQGDTVRVTGKKRDDLQEGIALIKTLKIELPLQFNNFRD